MTIETESQADAGDDAPRIAPTPESLSDGVARLLEEAHATLVTDRWTFLDTRTERVTWLVYDAAALRHCCQLVREIDIAARAGQEFAVRILGRTHLEAWLVATYIHFGGFDALVRVAQDDRYNLEAFQNDADEFDKQLAAQKKAAREGIIKLEDVNKGIAGWNAANPDKPAKPLRDLPYVPQLSPSGLDLSDLIVGFGPYEAQSLPVSEIVDALTKMAPAMGFGRESFRPMYHIYRAQSTIGSHASMSVFDSYFIRGHYVRTAPSPVNGSVIDKTWASALHLTAYLAGRVLGDRESATPVADEIRAWLEPKPNGHSAWSPGI